MYEVGEMPRLTQVMVGWEVEMLNAETQQHELAVIKRVDADMNCALVVFGSGQKEWMDLSMTKLKVIGRPSLDTPIDGATADQVVVESDVSVYGGSGRTMQELIPPIKMPVPKLSVPLRSLPSEEQASARRMSTAFVPLEVPSVDSEEFDWYTEGGHVELCDGDGVFHEGAVLCSRSQTHVQLFNENRQFFEVSIAAQAFKVVIHGLLTLKTIPMGQSVDVYSPMTGGFRSGTVLKTAELGRLTPISFPPGKAVEWLDLSSQTFKLVFVPPGSRTPANPTSIAKAEAHLDRNRQTSNTADSSPDPRSPPRHFRRSAQYPHLHLGQRVEFFDDDSKQYIKYIVSKVLDVGAHEYIFEPDTRASSSSSPTKGMQTGTHASVVGALPQLRCRLPLQTSHWQEYREFLTEQRVDVYDKIGRSVLTGRVMEVSATDAEPSLLVRYKDGRKEWVFLRSSKVKLRLHGHEVGGTESSGAYSPLKDRAIDPRRLLQSSGESLDEGARPQLMQGSSEQEPEKTLSDADEPFTATSQQSSMRYRPKLNRRLSDCPSSDLPAHQQAGFTNSLRNVVSENSKGLDTDLAVNHDDPRELASTPARPPKLSRRLSDCPNSDLVPQQQQQFAASHGNSLLAEPTTDRIPEDRNRANILPTVNPIDLGQLVRISPSDTDEGTESSDAVRPSQDQAPTATIEAPSDLDLWTEEMDSARGIVQYVHVLTGIKQLPRPTWLRRIDPASGKCFAVHTPTDTVIEIAIVPPKTSGRSSARGLSSSGRVTLPVGPIEAIRAQASFDQLPKSDLP